MKPFAGALASALLLSIAGIVEAPWHWFALIALAPWLWSLSQASLWQALASAAVLAVGFTAGAFFPLAGALKAYSGAPLWLAWMVTLGLGPFALQPQFFAAAAARVGFRRRGPVFAACATALAYVGAEWLFPRLFDDTLGYALHPSAVLRQAADIAGGRGLTLLCLAVSECAILRKRALAFALVAATAGYGFVRLRQFSKPSPTFSAGVVQANITAYDKLAAEQGTYETVRQILDAHRALSRTLGPVDLLVWPETVYPTTFGAPKSPEGAEFDAQIAQVAQKTPLVFGAFEDSDQGEHNAAFFLEGGKFATYRKSLLFPLTEHVPGWLDSPWLRRALPWTGHWQPGPGAEVIPIALASGPLRVAPLICYEVLAQSYVARAAREGAELLLAISNDAWWPGDRAPRLHLVMASFRAIENRLPMVRATNSGISALVSPTGEIVQQAPFETVAALRLNVPRVASSWTPAKAFGDWLGPVSLLLLALLYAARARIEFAVSR